MPYTKENIGYADTDTSLAAAISIKDKTTSIRDIILGCLSHASEPMTSDELSDVLGIDFISVRPRLTELKNDGLIEDSGERRLGRFNKNIIAWRVSGMKETM